MFLGREDETLKNLGNWEYIYHACVFIWIILGLCYLVMIIELITDGLKKQAKVIIEAEREILDLIYHEIDVIKSSKVSMY